MGKFLVILIIIAIAVGGLGVSTYNGLVGGDESVAGAWSDVQNSYKRRSDLIPQLVETVKGAADFEQTTITEVTEARASVGKMSFPEGGPATQAEMDQYVEAQSRLGAGLGRLMLVAENYPQLRATEGFRDLQNLIEGTENRISVARKDYIATVKSFNTRVRSFPGNLLAGMFGFERKPHMEFDEGVEEIPEIDFSKE